ncbi:MAG: hypothetical protein ACI4UE_05240 [Candidatus Scatovivens sp.]
MNQKRKYKNLKKIDKNTKKMIIFLVIFIVIIIVMNILLNYLEKREDSSNNKSSQYSSIQEILEKYECTFIKEEKSKDENYSKDIYLKFKYNTFEENESKQRFFDNVIGNIYLLLDENFRLIDESKNLTIEVKKNENSYIYAINGELDYFINEASKKTLENYSEEAITKFEINSTTLADLINNKWNYDNINFGSKDTTFEDYEIYFDEGIEVRKISKKVYNLVFNSKYKLDVVNNIAPGASFEKIISKLGNPTYGTSEANIIGYKGKDIYVFFSKDEISIYRNENTNTKEFEELLKKYANKQMDIKEFMNELTYLWDDYSEYQYDNNFIKIIYPLKGIKIYMDSDNSKNIEVYGNYSNIDELKELVKDKKVQGKFNENLVHITEISRKDEKDELLYMCYLQTEIDSIKTESSKYGYYIDTNKINFVSKDGTRPNETIIDNFNTGFWYTDTIFIYSIKGKGIYSYNLDNHIKTKLLEGEDDYTFLKYENNILTYDKDKKLEIS